MGFWGAGAAEVSRRGQSGEGDVEVQLKKWADVYLHLPISLPEINYSASPHLQSLAPPVICSANQAGVHAGASVAQGLRRAFGELVTERAQFLLGACQ
jgi:hypothetical protein